MMTRQITEEEFIRMQNLNGFAQSMLANPESARLLEQAAKIVNPNIKTPRLDAANAAAQPIAALQESMNKIQERLDAEAAARASNDTLHQANVQREKDIASLRKAGWNDAGIEAIEKVRTERGIASVLDAAVVFEKIHPAPAPAMPGSTGAFNLNESINTAKPDEDIKKLLATRGRETNGLEAISNKMIADTLADIRSNQG